MATNAWRILRPSSKRIGIFCKFGSVELSRPVAVKRLLETSYALCYHHDVLLSLSPSIYVDCNFAKCAII